MEMSESGISKNGKMERRSETQAAAEATPRNLVEKYVKAMVRANPSKDQNGNCVISEKLCCEKIKT